MKISVSTSSKSHTFRGDFYPNAKVNPNRKLDVHITLPKLTSDVCFCEMISYTRKLKSDLQLNRALDFMPNYI